MVPRKVLAIIMALALVTLACGVNVNLPLRDVKTGPTQTEAINVPAPAGTDEVAEVRLGFGAGKLNLASGAGAALVSGTATYNVEDLKPEVEVDGNRVRIDTGDLNLEGIPDFGDNFINEWALNLGTAPMRLTIAAGAYEGDYELGGLSLQSLEIGDGAANVDLAFSQPNLVEMETFRYQTGASNVELRGLANANFANLSFKSGAGDYTLDFSGELKRDAAVTIDAGFSSVKLIVPQGVNAQVDFDGGLANVDTFGGWEQSGDQQYAQTGAGPRLTINVNMGAGELELRNQE